MRNAVLILLEGNIMTKRIVAGTLAAVMAFGGLAAEGVGTSIADEISISASAANSNNDFSFDYANKYIDGYIGTSTNVVIPSTYEGYTVKGIADSVFSGNTTITSVTIPKTVTYIGEETFNGCTSLKTVKLSEGLQKIGRAAFGDCENLVNISIPKTVMYIDDLAFANCSKLKQMTIPYGIEEIGEYAIGYQAHVKRESYGSVFNKKYRNVNVFDGVINSFKINYYPTTRGEEYVKEWLKSADTTDSITATALHNSITSASISGIKNKTYTGGKVGQATTIVVKYNGKTLVNGTDYKLTYSKDIVNVGTKTVTITGLGAFSGSIKKTYKITKKNVSSLTVKLSTSTCIYTGKAVHPKTVKVVYGSKTLKRGTDYTLKFANNVKIGTNTAKVVITGKGNYTGTVTKTFSIKKNIKKAKATYRKSNALVSGASVTFSYTGNYIKPNPIVKYGKTTLKKGTDYTLSYSSNISTGKATVYIKGKGKYTGTIKKNFYIAPKKVTSLSGGGSSANSYGYMYLSWQMIDNCDGYQLYFSSRKDFKTKKVIDCDDKNFYYPAIEAKTNKTYYFKVRAYKTIDGKKVYGNWSNVASGKVLKS
jgi:hypothetical protein